MEASERKTKRKKKKHFGFIGFLIFAFVLIVVFNVTLSFKSRLTTTIVRRGSEEDLISAQGYIFRDQTIITAPGDGYLVCAADEDERVSLGETVMYIYKNEINLQANSEIKAIEEKIERLKEASYSGEIFSNDTAKLEQTISQNLRDVPRLAGRGDIEAVSEVSRAVDFLIEKRRIIAGEIEAPDSKAEIQKLEAEKAQLEQKYNIERTRVHAPVTGTFTARIDGLEEKLTLKALSEITPEYIKEIGKLFKEARVKEKTKQGEPIGKIVDNFGWSVAALVPQTEVEGLEAGDTINIRFPDLGVETISGTISRITPEVSGKVIMIVSTNRYVDKIYSASQVNVEFIKNYYDGYRIPAKSLRMTDGRMGVYVIRSGKARFITVDLLYNGKNWIVVSDKAEDSPDGKSALKLYDELIVSGNELYDGKVVR